MVAIVAALAVLVILAAQSGLGTSGIKLGTSASSTADGQTVVVDATVRNTGLLEERLVSAETDAPWVTLESASFTPESIARGQEGLLTLHLIVACDGGPPPLDASSTITLKTARPWGTAPVTLADDWGVLSSTPYELACGED